MARLVAGKCRESGRVQARIDQHHQFASRYSDADIGLLAKWTNHRMKRLVGRPLQRVFIGSTTTLAISASSVCVQLSGCEQYGLTRDRHGVSLPPAIEEDARVPENFQDFLDRSRY